MSHDMHDRTWLGVSWLVQKEKRGQHSPSILLHLLLDDLQTFLINVAQHQLRSMLRESRSAGTSKARRSASDEDDSAFESVCVLEALLRADGWHGLVERIKDASSTTSSAVTCGKVFGSFTTSMSSSCLCLSVGRSGSFRRRWQRHGTRHLWNSGITRYDRCGSVR